MLRKIRISLAAVFFFCLCLLFLDFTGTIHSWLGWMAKIQFVPAALALNFGVVALLAVITLLFGRVYCSVICPLGIMQDIVSWIHGKTAKKARYRFHYRKALTVLRIVFLAVFIILGVAGMMSIAALIEPYSTFGRIMSNLFAPIYASVNNLFAYFAERAGSYAFYSTDVWIKSIPTFIAAILIFVLLIVLAWKDGRIWCNTVCPVGTFLGFISRFSLFAPTIDTSKCNGCGLCGKSCKASCINTKEHKIDTSRCVVCMDCINNCRQGAIGYRVRWDLKSAKLTAQQSAAQTPGTTLEVNGKAALSDGTTVQVNGNIEQINSKSAQTTGKIESESRRSFINGVAIAAGTTALAGLAEKAALAQEMKVDGGITELMPKTAPKRTTPIVPAGSQSLRHFSDHCIACQLCVSVCPNNVLRPAVAAGRFMQPEMSYEKGYCRPECTECSEVCPAGAIIKVDIEQKTDIKIGTAHIDYSLCLPSEGKDSCGNCARHCPSHAIIMVSGKDGKFKIPTINEEECIGCGACEYLCPARPISAIKVEGIEVHHDRA